ncbi:hypothetical protein [Methylobacterium oryzae]|uniref:Protein of unassigned function n=1 Tax=Methylobacterium oryzae CBMB20 TaxID=693986 RepID=A0A089Q293_9HYPH|nr:hypothetical protein [Methylobacterium oryzae]AIQ88719.1 protein of unassigned function [Methylobacterium oryzae CBMB20]
MTPAQYDALARKLLRAELAARGARDLDVAEAYVSKMVRLDPETGDHIGTVDHAGTPLISLRDGAPYMTLDEVLTETMKSKPDLFGGNTIAPGRVGQPPAHNPFAKGEHFNLTRGMEIFRQDEALGWELMSAAGYHMEIRR